MGATESLFYDETPAETPSLPTRPSRVTATEPRPVLSSNTINVQPRRLNNGNAATRPHHPSRRRAPPQTKPIKRMEGLVLGCPKTGKRTLLSRLEGIDPFALSREMKSAHENGRSDMSERDNETCNPSITIPYKPPLECPTWDRIKLHVRYANSFDSDSEEMIVRNTATVKANVDFVVVIINPKDSRETTQSYLEGVLKSYLDRSGHVEGESGSDNNNEGKEENFASNNSSASDITEACCIAVLFNFRDLQKGQEKEEGEGVSTTDLELLVYKSLQSRNVPEEKRVVELFDTSLLNCYGLDGLHRFIYRAYLQRSQKDTERQLCIVWSQIQHTSTNNNNEVKSKQMAYDEFLKEISPENTDRSSQQQQQPTSNTPTIDQQQLQQHQEQPVVRSLNLSQSKKNQHSGQIPSSRIGEDALEAFLASSSDEEDEKKPIDRRRDGSPNNFGVALSSDDDSDDDFFYDESGHRRSDHKDNGRDEDRSRTGGRYHKPTSLRCPWFTSPFSTGGDVKFC